MANSFRSNPIVDPSAFEEDDPGLSESLKRASVELEYLSRSNGTTYLQRIDPLWRAKSSDGFHSPWIQPSLIKPFWEISPGGMIVKNSVSKPVAISHPLPDLHSWDYLRVIATLFQMNQVSFEQLKTLLGWSDKKLRTVLRRLNSAGIAKKKNPQYRNMENRWKNTIWKLDVKSSRLDELVRSFSDLEHALVFCGYDITETRAASTHGLQHDLVTNEILIRSIESIEPIVAFFGDILAKPRMMNETPALNSKIEADGVLVRADGLRVFIETVNLISPSKSAWSASRAKVWKWLKELERNLAENDDCVVVYVDIGDPSSRRFRTTRFWTTMLDAVSKSSMDRELKVGLESTRKRILSKIFYVHVSEWFPFPNSISSRFTNLEVVGFPDRKWKSLLDIPMVDRTEVSRNAISMLHTPIWVSHHIKELGNEADGQWI